MTARPPRIVVLDGHPMNPGDLSWAPLEALGEVTVHPRTAPEETVARLADAELALTNKVVLDRAVLAQLPRLRYIGVTATGVNVVDLAAARERGLVVTNVPAYSTASVAQLTFALLLELTHGVAAHSRAVHAGRWSAGPDFSFTEFPLRELAGQTFGLVGFGHIGRAVARLAAAFGMRVLVHTRTVPDDSPPGVRFVTLETLFRESDVLSLHCPLTEETRHLLNRERLALMKPDALLLNTGRGPLLDEAAVAEALNAGRLGGAGLDVLSAEPPPPDHPLLGARHCWITPHIGWATTAARQRLMDAVVDNVRAFLAGRPKNIVTG
jgi:glycerate dehydrogenase